MKNMKLFYTLLTGLILMTACSKDEEEPPTIVGTWVPIAIVEVCSTGSVDYNSLNACEQSSRLIFSSNGNFSETFYALDENDIECVLSSVDSGVWEIIDGELFINYKYDGVEVFTFFELNYEALRIGENVNDLDTPCNNGYLSHSYVEFERL